jgi:ATP-dependent DNA helicase 2 subunit 2
MPFADDTRRYTFASLNKLISKTGEEITKHPYIPTDSQQAAMDNFVDAMDLMAAGDKDEEGYAHSLPLLTPLTNLLFTISNRMPWFNPVDSYNPSIHRVKQAMFHCAVVSDITTYPLPPPHPELLKYFNPPKRVRKHAKPFIDECIDAFKVKEVPKRVAKADTAKKGHEHAAEEDEMLLLDRKRGVPSAPSKSGMISPMKVDSIKPEPVSPSIAKGKGKAKAVNPDDSDTEEDEEAEDEYMTVQRPEGEDESSDFLLNAKKPSTPQPSSRPGGPLPTPARSVSPPIDPGRAPGRIIGSTYPLRDLEKNLSQGDVVTKAVQDLCDVITEIVMKPFASRRSKEMIECMKVLRDTCLKVSRFFRGRIRQKH